MVCWKLCVAATALYIKIGHGTFPLIFYNSPTTTLLKFNRIAKRTLNTLTGVIRSAPTHRTAPHDWRAGSGGSPVHFCSQWLISRYQTASQWAGGRPSVSALMRSIARRIFKQLRAAPLLIQTVNRTRRRNLRFVKTSNCCWKSLRIYTRTNSVSGLCSAFTKFSVVQCSGLARRPEEEIMM